MNEEVKNDNVIEETVAAPEAVEVPVSEEVVEETPAVPEQPEGQTATAEEVCAKECDCEEKVEA